MARRVTDHTCLAVAALLSFAVTTSSSPAFAQAPFTTNVVKSPPQPLLEPTENSPWAAISPQISAPTDPSGAVAVKRIELRGDSRKTEIVLTIAKRTPVSAFALFAPNRVVVDGRGFEFSTLQDTSARSRLLLSAPRYGALANDMGRLMFDAVRPIKIGSITGKPVGDAVEVTVTVLPAQAQSSAPALHPATWGGAAVPADTSTSALAPAPKSLLSATPTGRPVVVLDPGHGGVDPGAVSEQLGVLEKEVVLAVALRVRTLLEARDRVQVVMTRNGDDSVRLDQRVAVARAHKADLFVSVHADTYAGQASAQVRGGSVYVLAAQATNEIARALADKENAADVRAGLPVAQGTNQAVDTILADLTVRETQALSHNAQSSLLQSLRKSILLAREPARAAAFRVLKQAETPAVLIELGYMSNSQDISLLQSPDWQAAVAARIADGIDAYVSATLTAASPPASSR